MLIPINRRLRTVGLCLIGGTALAACGGAAAPAASSSPSAAASASALSSAPASRAVSAKPSGAASAGAAAAVPTIPADQPVSITIGTGVPAIIFTPIWIAYDQGYFKRHGLDVKMDQIEGVPQAQAIVAGDIQIGAVGGTEVLDSRIGGADLIAIQQQSESPAFQIHVNPSIKKLADLKGKTIAVTRIGSSTDITTRVMLAKNGLNPATDVTELAANNPAGILAALEGGKVQAGTLAPPNDVVANKAGFPKLVSALDEHVPLQMGLIDTTKAYADKHPEVVYAYLEAELEGTRDFLNKPDIAIQEIAKTTKVNKDVAQQGYEAMKPVMTTWGPVDPAGLKTVQQYGKNTKTRQLNVADAYDNKFIQALKASGFIKGLAIKGS